jgi:hypothetical protein
VNDFNDTSIVSIKAVGAGSTIDRCLFYDARHPEMDQTLVQRAHVFDEHQGCCQLHRDTLEHPAADLTLVDRRGTYGKGSPPDHPARPLKALYICLAIMHVNQIVCRALACMTFGGSAKQKTVLASMILKQYIKLINGDMQDVISSAVDELIALSKIPGSSATLGARMLTAIALAHDGSRFQNQ